MLYFPSGVLHCGSVLLPSCSSQFIRMWMWNHQVCQPPPGPPWSSSCCLAASALHPGCRSPPLLPVWVNVSSLTPWLSDFYTVQFSGNFLFLNLLSFFRLCKEAKCIYLCLYLGWKSLSPAFNCSLLHTPHLLIFIMADSVFVQDSLSSFWNEVACK